MYLGWSASLEQHILQVSAPVLRLLIWLEPEEASVDQYHATFRSGSTPPLDSAVGHLALLSKPLALGWSRLTRFEQIPVDECSRDI